MKARHRQSRPDRFRRLARSVRARRHDRQSTASASSSVGTAPADVDRTADVVIDAGGMTAIPGLIDSHVHITFGDYTPRQRTVGYLESYLHGGITTAISASEVHVPGRPRDAEGVKALAVAAQRCFADYRPGGMRVIAGSVILEPGLHARRLRRAAAERRAARQGRLRRGRNVLRLRAAGRRRQGRRPDHHLPHRRLVDPGLRRHHRRPSAEDAPARVVPHQWRADRHARRGFRAGHPRIRDRAAGLHRRQSAHHAAVRAARRRSTAPSTASSSRPTRRPAAASCRSACSTPSRISRASPTCRRSASSARRPAATRRSTASTAACSPPARPPTSC